MNISIREVSKKEESLAIAKELPDFFSPQGLVSLKEDLETQKIFGAFVDDNFVGFITFRESDVRALEIIWLAVLPNWQGLGIGSKLVRESLNLLSDKKYKVCYVKTLAETVVDAGYEKTRNFYKKLGFSTLEIIDPYPSWDAGNPCQILATGLPLE